MFERIEGVSRSVALSLVVLLSACVDDVDKSLFVQVVFPNGEPAQGYVFIAAYEDHRVEKIHCTGEESTDDLQCRESGVLVKAPSETMEVTVKHMGYEFQTKNLILENLASSRGNHEAKIELELLAPFEVNDDYCTGFETDGGLGQFESSAYKSDSEVGPIHAVKFYIKDLDTNPKVYFMNTNKHRIHYFFVRDVLGIPMTRTEYDIETYYEEDRTAMAGTLVYYPKVLAPSEALGASIEMPVALTFFPSDRLSPVQVTVAYRLIEERLGFASLWGGQMRFVYLPAGSDNEEKLKTELNLFERVGALWMLRTELYGNSVLQILNKGEAFGTLKRLSPEALETEIVSYADILVLTRLPNTLPIVGGTITEEMQTPLSHVNVASISRGTPNIALLNAGDDPKISALMGKLVHFKVEDGGYSLDETTMAEAVAFWEGQHKDPIVPEFDLDFKGLPEFDELAFEDSVRVGAKAANVAELSSLIGDYAPYGFVVPFSYYNEFTETTVVTESLCEQARMDCLEEGRTQAICNAAASICVDFDGVGQTASQYASRLMARDDFASDSSLREALLDGLRHHLRTVAVDPVFADALNSKITLLFGGQKVRLRSSTNAEDLSNFTGAGLYNSVSAYGEGDSKLGSEQIRKVWASVWNWRAFEERSFWNVDHGAVFMGVLVHQAFPDEAANGVLVTQNLADLLTSGMYVNVQLGEVSVTNPLNGATPEIFSIVAGNQPGSIQIARLAYSSLSAETPILSQGEVHRLYQVSGSIKQHFAILYGNPSWDTAAFDLEFKFHGPDRDFFVKQVRPFVASSY